MARFVILFFVLSFTISSSAFASDFYRKADTLQMAKYDTSTVTSVHISVPRFINKNIELPEKFQIRGVLPNMLDNIGLWYLIQGMKYDLPENEELRDALNVLLKYAGDKELKGELEAIRKTSKDTREKVDALGIVQNKVTLDSIMMGDNYMDENDMQLLVENIQNDSTFQWLKKISRDSTKLTIINHKNQITDEFWVNSGRHQFRRAWFTTAKGDTVGAWLEVIPSGNNLRVNLENPGERNLMSVKKQNNDLKLRNTLSSREFELKYDDTSLKRKYWTYYSTYDLTMSQTAFSNWIGGGDNSASTTLRTAFFLNFNKNKVSWENYLKCDLGMIWYKGTSPRKSTDYLELNTKLGIKSAKNWYYTLQFNMKSQLFKTYRYNKDKKTLQSTFMTPAYMRPSLGMDYKPNGNLSLLISPLAGNITFVRDTSEIPQKRFGIERGKRVTSDVGADISYRHNFNNLWKILNVRSDMKIFLNYNKRDYKIPVTLTWKMNFDFRINYFMSTKLIVETRYLEKSSKRFQLKESLELGLKFRL